MKRSRRYRLGALPLGLSPLQLGLAVAALGGIAYFAFRKTETEAAVDEAQAAVEAGEASPDAAAAAVVAVQGPQAAQKTVADDIAPALVAAASAENPAAAPKTQAEKVVKTKILSALIKSGRVTVPPAITKMAIARKLSDKTGVGTGAKKVKPKLDPCSGLTGKAATDCRANKAFSQLPSF